MSAKMSINNIILIGPVGAGKSTQGELVAKALKMKSVSLDGIANDYYEENGFDMGYFQKLKKEIGYLEAYRQWWPSLAYAAKKVVKDFNNSVIDFGAGHSHYEDRYLFESVRTDLAKFRNVILLLPSPDLDRSVALIRERSISRGGRNWIYQGYDFIEHWVKDECNHLLATNTIYTEGKKPDQTRDEILGVLN